MKKRYMALIVILITSIVWVSCNRMPKMLKPAADDLATDAMMEMPTVADPEAFTVALVEAAIDFQKINGAEATAVHYNDPASIDGQWYVFITNANDISIASAPSPHFIGTDIKNVISSDGSMIGVAIAKATGTGRWIEYLWPHPLTGENQQKRSWSIRHDGYLFGSGYYRDAPTADASE